MGANARWLDTFSESRGIFESHVNATINASLCGGQWLFELELRGRSHQTFCPDPAVKLPGIMLRNRCWPTTFYTITVGDANAWCRKWLVWLAPDSWHHPLTSLIVIVWKVLGEHLFLNIIPGNFMVETGRRFWYDRGMSLHQSCRY